MALIGRISPTRGALVKLRTNLTFIQNGLDILKLKRDRLAEELNLLLKETSHRDKAERDLKKAYEEYETALALLSYSRMRSIAFSMDKIKVDVRERSIMNVIVPTINLVEKPSRAVIQDPSLYQVGQKMSTLADEWLDIACLEASIERIAHELMLVNRKINAIEKVVIPNYSTQIRYIEDFLSDEELEDFTRIKHIKTMAREQET